MEILKSYAEVAAKESGSSIETFWLIQDSNSPELFRLITRFQSPAEDAKFNGQEEVKAVKAKLVGLAEALKEQNNKWAKQGFFLKL